MPSFSEIIRDQVYEFKRLDPKQIRDIAEHSIVRRIEKEGKGYLIEVHGKAMDNGNIAIMVQCSRDLPIIRWFSQAKYFLFNRNEMIEGSNPW